MNLIRCYILLLFCSSLRAGNDPALVAARIDFKKTNEVYASMNGLSMEMYYMVYTDHKSQTVIEGKNGKYIKFKDHLYTKIDGIETYAIDDKLISINEGSRKITVGDNKPWNLSPLQMNVDSLLTFCGDIQVKDVSPNERKYELFFEEMGSEFGKIDVYIDIKNSRYTKIVLYYSAHMNLSKDFYAEEKQPRLEIVYKNFKQLEEEPPIFSQELYVLNIENKLKPAPKYYNYKVLDLRNQTKIKTKK